MHLFDKYFKKYPNRLGIILAIIGVIILTPDTMVMRFSNLEEWPLMGWRGVLMGVTLLIIWFYFLKTNVEKELRSLCSWKGFVVIFAFSINSIFFTLGILETSVMLAVDPKNVQMEKAKNFIPETVKIDEEFQHIGLC